jgi:DNA-binding transcriptional regulator YhcF (GntR family)
MCPCKDYKNQKRKVEREVYKDLVKHGFVENYEGGSSMVKRKRLLERRR